MERIDVIVDKDIITARKKEVELNQNIAVCRVDDAEVVEFYSKGMDLEVAQHIISPICCNKDGEGWLAFYNAFSSPLSSLPQDEMIDLCNTAFVKQVIWLFDQLSYLKPAITLQNTYILPKQPFKVRICQRFKSDAQYLTAFQTMMKKICINSKQILSRANRVKQISDLKEIIPQQIEGKTLSKLLQLKFPANKAHSKIAVQPADMQWIFTSFGFTSTPKHELIYNGLQHNFDPSPLLKAIAKQTVFYLIQSTQGNKVAFYPAVKYQPAPSIFGSYLCDKQKKSILLGLARHSIHTLEQQQYAVGYGQEILLSIGKLDIVLSAFNISNVSYFPMSYKIDEKAGATRAEDLLNRGFKLRQVQVYKIS